MRTYAEQNLQEFGNLKKSEAKLIYENNFGLFLNVRPTDICTIHEYSFMYHVCIMYVYCNNT